jgi:Ser/Thr protein kinase RdoA (MazF antagonist)
MRMSSPEDFVSKVISEFHLDPLRYSWKAIGSGFIHNTYKLSGEKEFILQRVNKNVFKKPEVIASNIRTAADYLKEKFPDYLFISPLPAKNGTEMVFDEEGFPWRIFPYFKNTFTVDKVSTENEAFVAAAEFGKLTRLLNDVDTNLFHPTIDRFHDLAWRYEQFELAIRNHHQDRLSIASREMELAQRFSYLVTEYRALIESKKLRPRITHNDTKINNVLFDSTTGNTVCAIDLDTLMPGYFIYDLGDMIRTFVSPVDEEERDLSKVIVRKNIYDALVRGYLSQMNDVLSAGEKTAIGFSGLMMTYIMALRMLTDFLNGDVYYQTKYPDHNLVRAKNQFKLLEELERFEYAILK